MPVAGSAILVGVVSVATVGSLGPPPRHVSAIVPSARSDRFVSFAQNSVGGCGQLMGLHLGQEDGAKMRTVEAEHKPIKPETTLETRQGFHAVGGDHAAVV
jgi:hypothetical protein